MSKKYLQAREDYEYLRSHHNSSDAKDCGGMMEEWCWIILERPTKSMAAKVYVDLIVKSFSDGFEDGSGHNNYSFIEPDLRDSRVVEIYERYGLI
jgi:hypothetical protein